MEILKHDKNNIMRSLISPKYLNKKYIERVLVESIDYCTYFLTDGEYVKIGVAASLPNRVKQLQTGNPRKIKAMFVIPAAVQSDSLKTERKLHEYFGKKKVLGEWFDIDADSIKEGCARLGIEIYIPASKFDFEVDGIEVA